MPNPNAGQTAMQEQPLPLHNQGGLRRDNSTSQVLRSRESIAQGLSDNLKARRSSVSYDYLATGGDGQRQGKDQGKYSYHTTHKPSNGKSYDYVDEDQNRLSSEPYGAEHRSRAEKSRTAASYFHSESDEDVEEINLDHDIRMLEAKQTAALAHKWANPGPIGLLGFGMTTVMLNLHNTGSFNLFTPIPALGICFGGGAQLIAGLLEWVRGNTFAFIAFSSYGSFWLTLVCVWMLPNASSGGAPIVNAANGYFVGVYLALWGIFSFFMTICTLRMNVAIFSVFFTVTLLFFLLAGGSMANNAAATRAAGYEGIVCGALALYLGVAEVLNEVWDRTILPVLPMTQLLGWLGAGKKKNGEEEEEEEGHAKAK